MVYLPTFTIKTTQMWVDIAYMNSMGYLYNIICSTDCTFAFIYNKSPICENSPGQPTWRTCRCAPFFFCISLLRINLKSVGTVRHFTLVMDRIYLTRFLCLVFPNFAYESVICIEDTPWQWTLRKEWFACCTGLISIDYIYTRGQKNFWRFHASNEAKKTADSRSGH